MARGFSGTAAAPAAKTFSVTTDTPLTRLNSKGRFFWLDECPVKGAVREAADTLGVSLAFCLWHPFLQGLCGPPALFARAPACQRLARLAFRKSKTNRPWMPRLSHARGGKARAQGLVARPGAGALMGRIRGMRPSAGGLTAMSAAQAQETLRPL